MYLLYSFCLSLLFVILFPYFLVQALRHGKYAGSFRQRMGRLPEALRNDGRDTIWVHAVSVGEFLAARRLIKALLREFPESRVVVSTTTLTGNRLAVSQSPAGPDNVFYFPFDWMFTVRRTLDCVKPRAVIVIETELWPNFFRECRRRGIVTALVNGRISERSFARYRRIRGFIGGVLDSITVLVMQSLADSSRALDLGAEPQKVRLCGNLKYDLDLFDKEPAAAGGDFAPALDSFDYLIVAGSTAPGEEAMLLSALKTIRRRDGLSDARLLIAPRHPERFDEVASVIERSGFKLLRRSGAGPESFADANSPDVILLDSIGELASVYSRATVVFVGGSLVPHGGHNVIEPAASARAIIVGPHTSNFRQIIAEFLEAGALIQLPEGEESSPALADQLARLLLDREAATMMGERALGVLNNSRGATDCSIRIIKQVLGE
jgi:3-deoxy-D-manno-octulosonic-acid transferase